MSLNNRTWPSWQTRFVRDHNVIEGFCQVFVSCLLPTSTGCSVYPWSAIRTVATARQGPAGGLIRAVARAVAIAERVGTCGMPSHMAAKGWIALHDFFSCEATGQVVGNNGHHDPRALDTSFAMADVWLHCDIVSLVHDRSLPSLCCLCYTALCLGCLARSTQRSVPGITARKALFLHRHLYSSRLSSTVSRKAHKVSM